MTYSIISELRQKVQRPRFMGCGALPSFTHRRHVELATLTIGSTSFSLNSFSSICIILSVFLVYSSLYQLRSMERSELNQGGGSGAKKPRHSEGWAFLWCVRAFLFLRWKASRGNVVQVVQ